MPRRSPDDSSTTARSRRTSASRTKRAAGTPATSRTSGTARSRARTRDSESPKRTRSGATGAKQPAKRTRASTKRAAAATTKRNGAASKTSARTRAKKGSAADPQETPSTSESTALTLPSRMSLRAIERAHVIRLVTGPESEPVVRSLALGIGYTFALLGALTTLGVAIAPATGPLQQAQLPCALTASCVEVSGTTSPAPLAQSTASERAAVEFRSAVPPTLSEPVVVEISTFRAAALRVTAEEIFTDAFVELAMFDPVADTERVSLDPAALPAGDYQLRYEVRESDGQSLTRGSGPRFTVPERAGASVSTSSATGTPSSTSAADLSGNATGTVATSSSASAADVAPDQNGALISVGDLRAADGYPVRVSNATAEYVELYAVRVGARRPTFLGTLRRSDGANWVGTIGPRELPVGTYELYARIASAGNFSRTAPTLLTVSRAPTATGDVVPATPPTLSSIPGAPVGTASDSYFSDIPIAEGDTATDTPVRAPQSSTNTRAAAVAADLLASASDVLDGQLQRYASARRSGNELALERARDAIEATRDDLVSEALLRTDTSAIANRIDAVLKTEIDALLARVDRYQALLAGRDESLSTEDRDGDGITDTDEEVLYGTDPRVADTDGDGVTDGVEITGGFDPLRATAEARITYGSPREVGMTDTDRLRIESVTPLYERDTDRGTPPVQARVSGTALPESYVTLFVFSEPIIATAATEADGSFSYVLERELIDGRHEIYAALTDNTGAIVAKSEPFAFVKEGAQYTRVGVGSSDDATAEPVSPPQDDARSYYITLALVVLALGLVLIVLGQSLLNRRPSPPPSS